MPMEAGDFFTDHFLDVVDEITSKRILIYIKEVK